MDYIKQIFKNKDLRAKILFVLLLLLVYRVISHIPIPVSDPKALKTFLEGAFGSNSFLSFLDIFSGGGISRFSVGMMAVGPYITATIIIQLLTMVIPRLEALSKEGEQGHHKINQYSRLLAVPLAFIEGYAMIRFIQNVALKQGAANFIGNPGIFGWFLILLAITAGTIFLMWLGEIITEKGIGNGISLIIFAGIIARVPQIFYQNVSKIFLGGFIAQEFIKILSYVILGLIVIFSVVLVTEGERRLTISYAKRVRGTRLYGGVDTYLPVKLNSAGVIPIIFAGAFMNIPQIIGFFQNAKNAKIRAFATYVQQTFAPEQAPYFILFFILVFAFTFFSTYLYFKPKDVAENIQKHGGFIPGFRPGNETERYLNYLISRITLWGAVFLGFIAVLPFLIQFFGKTSSIGIGGTGLLIVVAVALEIMKQIQAQLVVRRYEALV